MIKFGLQKKLIKEKAMLVRQLCQNYVFNALKKFHQTRMKSLFKVTWTLMNNSHLNLTHLGRHLDGEAAVKHKIKRVDRLLGNSHLHSEQLPIYKALYANILSQLDTVMVAVDWSGYDGHDHHILRASLLYKGRSLPIYNKLFPQPELGCKEAHELFLDGLKHILGNKKRVILVTDAGFGNPWFASVVARGWFFVGRARLSAKLKSELSDNWVELRRYANKATKTPTYVCRGEYGKKASKKVHACVASYKEEDKGRKEKSSYPDINIRYGKANRDPWLIVSNLDDEIYSAQVLINIYKKRMQIEQNFRDDKSYRFGFSWRLSRVKNKERIEIYCLIAAIATLLLWWIGLCCEKQGWHRKFQANTRKDIRVLSFITLGRQVIKHYKSIKVKLFRDTAKYFISSYNLELVEGL